MRTKIIILCCMFYCCICNGKPYYAALPYNKTPDTLYKDGKPYCLLYKSNESFNFKTFNLQQVVYLRTVSRNNAPCYELRFTPLQKIYYTPVTGHSFIDLFIGDLIKHEVIEDGYFSAYGANMLIQELKQKYPLTEVAEELEQYAVEKNSQFDWNISWKSTDKTDSTLVLADGKPFAYYRYRRWQDYGSEKWQALARTKASYVYILYNFDNSLMAEVLVADWWKTGVRVITSDGMEYSIKQVPNNTDFMTIVAKLLLVKQAEGK